MVDLGIFGGGGGGERGMNKKNRSVYVDKGYSLGCYFNFDYVLHH